MITILVFLLIIITIRTEQEISKNWHQGIILTLPIVNSKYDSKIQLTTTISKNVENKIFGICQRDRMGIRITKHINDFFERSVTSSYKSCSEINEEFFNKN